MKKNNTTLHKKANHYVVPLKHIKGKCFYFFWNNWSKDGEIWDFHFIFLGVTNITTSVITHKKLLIAQTQAPNTTHNSTKLYNLPHWPISRVHNQHSSFTNISYQQGLVTWGVNHPMWVALFTLNLTLQLPDCLFCITWHSSDNAPIPITDSNQPVGGNVTNIIIFLHLILDGFLKGE